MKTIIPSLVLLVIFLNPLVAQNEEALNPIVKGFGGVYEIENAVELPENKETKLLIDLKEAVTNRMDPEAEPDFSKPIWGLINTARLLNLHGVGGVEKENLEVIVVVHGPAVMSLFTDATYKKFFETEHDNPNSPILRALHEAGAKILVCGQSLIGRDIKPDQLFEHTEIALSALTTISKRVQEGYVVYNF